MSKTIAVAVAVFMGAIPSVAHAQVPDLDWQIAPGANAGDLFVHPSGLTGARAPQPGHTLFVESLLETGAVSMAISTDDAGIVFVRADPVEEGSEDLSGAAGPCSDGAYQRDWDNWNYFKKWSSDTLPTPWYIRTSTIPGYLDAAATIDAIKDSAAAWPTEHNDCGRGDIIATSELSQQYGGSTTAATDITADGYCTTPSRKSVISYAPLPNRILAVACAQTENVRAAGETEYNRLIDADVRINSDYTWKNTVSGCSGSRYLTRAVMTHEFGHSYGMWHVSESTSGYLTMSTKINGYCQQPEYTLGLGDMMGIERIYDRG
jgi:hypothetical protein